MSVPDLPDLCDKSRLRPDEEVDPTPVDRIGIERVRWIVKAVILGRAVPTSIAVGIKNCRNFITDVLKVEAGKRRISLSRPKRLR